MTISIVLFLALIIPNHPPVHRQTEVPSMEECFKAAAAVMAEYQAGGQGGGTGTFQVGCAIVTK